MSVGRNPADEYRRYRRVRNPAESRGEPSTNGEFGTGDARKIRETTDRRNNRDYQWKNDKIQNKSNRKIMENRRKQ